MSSNRNSFSRRRLLQYGAAAALGSVIPLGGIGRNAFAVQARTRLSKFASNLYFHALFLDF